MPVGRAVTDAIAPTLNARADALDIWSDRLVMYAAAMVHAEGQRRAAAAAGRKAARG